MGSVYVVLISIWLAIEVIGLSLLFIAARKFLREEKASAVLHKILPIARARPVRK